MITQKDIFLMNKACYIQLLIQSKETGTIWSEFYSLKDRLIAETQYTKLDQDQSIKVLYIESQIY